MDELTGPYTVLTVLHSTAAATAKGPPAIVLRTKELGTIVIPVPPGGVEPLRLALAKVEELHRLGTGHA